MSREIFLVNDYDGLTTPVGRQDSTSAHQLIACSPAPHLPICRRLAIFPESQVSAEVKSIVRSCVRKNPEISENDDTILVQR